MEPVFAANRPSPGPVFLRMTLNRYWLIGGLLLLAGVIALIVVLASGGGGGGAPGY